MGVTLSGFGDCFSGCCYICRAGRSTRLCKYSNDRQIFLTGQCLGCPARFIDHLLRTVTEAEGEKVWGLLSKDENRQLKLGLQIPIGSESQYVRPQALHCHITWS